MGYILKIGYKEKKCLEALKQMLELYSGLHSNQDADSGDSMLDRLDVTWSSFKKDPIHFLLLKLNVFYNVQ